MYRYVYPLTENADLIEEILWSHGALSISLEIDEKCIIAMFDRSDDIGLSDICGLSPVSISEVQEEDWKNTWFSGYTGTVIENIRILPFIETNSMPAVEKTGSGITGDEITVFLDPRESFGSGEHPSTVIAVKLFNLILKSNRNIDGRFKSVFPMHEILDIGTGSGILSIIASRTTDAGITAVEYDHEACVKAEYNFKINNCSSIRLVNSSIQDFKSDVKFSLIFANILCELHEKIIDQYLRLLDDKGLLIVSGISEKWEKHLYALLEQYGFKIASSIAEDGWCGAVFAR